MRTRSPRGRGHRSVPDRRNHRQGLLARSCGLVRQRVAAGDEPGVSVPDELRPGQWRSETGHRATLRLHRADDLHLQAQAEPQVRQRTRADVLRRQVLHRQGEQDQRPQRTAVAAGQPRQRRDAGSVDGGLQAEAAQRPDLPSGARHQRRTDHRRRGVPARQGARRRRHRRRRAVRGSLHDDDLLQESAHRPARQPRLSGAVRQARRRNWSASSTTPTPTTSRSTSRTRPSTSRRAACRPPTSRDSGKTPTSSFTRVPAGNCATSCST